MKEKEVENIMRCFNLLDFGCAYLYYAQCVASFDHFGPELSE